MAIRALLVDDHPAFLDAAERFLSTLPGLQVVACASSGAEALEIVDATRVDLVLLDLRMPGMDGIEVLRRLTALRHQAVVVALTMHDSPRYREAATAAGARAFLAKAEMAERLPDVIAALFPRA